MRLVALIVLSATFAVACGSSGGPDAVTPVSTSSPPTTTPDESTSPTTSSADGSTATTTTMAQGDVTTTTADPGVSLPPVDVECVVPTEQGKQEGCLVHDGILHRYLLQVPASYDPSNPAPLVMYFHGGGGNRFEVQRTGIFTGARDRGWLAVSVEGAELGQPADVGYTWNAMNCCGAPFVNGLDDIGMVRALIEELSDAYEVDPTRVYATGFSNGAMLVHRIGSELSDIVAAVAPAAGTIGGAPEADSPTVTIAPPPRPVPILLMHGMQDSHVRFEGGVNFRDRLDLSFQESASFWAAANGCNPDPVRTEESWGIHAVFENCDEPGDVVANAYREMGHAFPTIAKDAGVDGAVQVMDFFAAHTLP